MVNWKPSTITQPSSHVDATCMDCTSLCLCNPSIKLRILSSHRMVHTRLSFLNSSPLLGSKHFCLEIVDLLRNTQPAKEVEVKPFLLGLGNFMHVLPYVATEHNLSVTLIYSRYSVNLCPFYDHPFHIGKTNFMGAIKLALTLFEFVTHVYLRSPHPLNLNT